jgi:hypothetical protein
MNRSLLCWVLVPVLFSTRTSAADGPAFTPIEPARVAGISASSDPYPGGFYEVDNLLDGLADGSPKSEYSSAAKGTDTFVDFDFGAPTPLAAFRHVDRFDPATVAASQLILSNAADFDRPVAVFDIQHANSRGGITFFPFPSPNAARHARWKVTALGPQGYSTVGGSEITFFSAREPHDLPRDDRIEVTSLPVLTEKEDERFQSVEAVVRHPYKEPTEATIELDGISPTGIQLQPGETSIELSIPAVERETRTAVLLKVAGQTVVRQQFELQAVRPWEMYILPHSHVDIGYTHVQTEVERMQWKYLEQAIEIARRTADYPSEARFKWNTEGLWAVDSYLRQASSDKRREFIEAVRRGWIHLDALYGNQLTGLCRPEELFRLVGCARRISRDHGLAVDAAMISDVPGYTWGIVPVLAQSGVKYLSIGPNHCHRIGYTLDAWGDRPFYWISPSGQEKVLCWMAGKAYSWFHNGLLGRISQVRPRDLLAYLAGLAEAGYPFDLVQVRYSIGGDNGPPDPDLCDFVRDWNARHVYPRLVIATTRDLFLEFQRRYGDQIPEVRGDFTPYWEDGAGSSARETALARSAAERLIQAEALWAIMDPASYPVGQVSKAWRNVLLYNEHTWGAHCSISQPDSQFTKDQWAIKQAFALDADKQSRELVDLSLSRRQSDNEPIEAVDVYNLNSWPRTDVVKIAGSMPVLGDRVHDGQHSPVPSQRLRDDQRSGDALAFLAENVPPLGAKRYYLQDGKPLSRGEAKVEGNWLSVKDLRLEIDAATGAIAKLAWRGAPADLVDSTAGTGLDDYFYVPGRNSDARLRNGKPEIVCLDRGPLVASVKVSTDEAPGCVRLDRIYRVFSGLGRVDIANVVVKEQVRTKESVHFGFPFRVPGGVLRMDVPWAVVRPEVDQLPGACKNYLTVGRWVDVSNDQYGVTWTTLDAPLIEIGDITVDVTSPFELTAWIKRLEPSSTFYSYVMNNYWETNYRADQEGKTVFRYTIWPHGAFDAATATRRAIQRSQPLLVVPVEPDAPTVSSLFNVQPASVIVTLLKPTDEGNGLILRLFNAGDRPEEARIVWREPSRWQMFRSSPFEKIGRRATDPVKLPPYGIVTLRAELAIQGTR